MARGRSSPPLGHGDPRSSVALHAHLEPFGRHWRAGTSGGGRWSTAAARSRNVAYVVASNQAASLAHYPPFSWPGGSQIVDFEGRLLARVDPGPGEFAQPTEGETVACPGSGISACCTAGATGGAGGAAGAESEGGGDPPLSRRVGRDAPGGGWR